MKRNLLGTLMVFALIMVLASFSFAEIKNPDTIIRVRQGAPLTLDPNWCYDHLSSDPIRNMYEGLVQYKGSSVTEFAPILSTEVPSVKNGLISEDGLNYTFPIREGVKFHNGDILTPEDVVYSLKRFLIFDRAGGPQWMLFEPFFGTFSIKPIAAKVAGVENYNDLFVDGDPGGELKSEYKEAMQKVITDYIDKIVSIDGNKVILHLPKPYGPFLHIVRWINVLDKKWAIEQGAWDGKADTWWKYHDPLCEDDPLYAVVNGTGPFVLKKWVPEEIVMLESFDDYWKGPAKIKNVQIKNIKEWTTRKLMLQAGDADLVDLPAQYLDEVKELEGVRVLENLPLLENDGTMFTWTINTEGNKYIGSGKLDGKGIPPDFFSDIHVRKAFSYLFPYDIFIKENLQGRAIRSPGPIPKPLLGYFDDPSFFYEFNLEKAKEEFKQAWGGQVWEKGFEFSMVCSVGFKEHKTLSDMIATYAKMINSKFKINVTQMQWSAFLKEFHTGKFPMWTIYWGADYPDPHNFFPVWIGSKGVYSASFGEAYRKFAEKNIDPLLEKGLNEADNEKRAAIYKELLQIVHDQAISLYMYQPTQFHVERSWLKGYVPQPVGGLPQYYLWTKSE